MKIEPMFDRVVVREERAESRTQGGLIIPENAQRKAYRGHVVAVGRGKRDNDGELIPMEVKVGDYVLFGKYSGTDFKLDGQDFVSMPQTDIMAIILPDEADAVAGLQMGDERVVGYEPDETRVLS